ncbi:hypothetical protein [Microlunatus endophyticus]|uniref:hypothetical protein n=1 Tax=Microlunatus endophyticus TaxID=1716077 RepID=UPI001667FB51|nr:hypothetical protein [Microlunatus endophyticus]
MGQAEQPGGGGGDGGPVRARHDAPDTHPGDSSAAAVPVVLPRAVVTVDDTGDARIVVEHIGHHDAIDSPDGPVGRGELGAVLAGIAEQIGGPVRVEVREPDGSRYADILQPHPPQPRPDTEHQSNESDAGPLLRGEGFLPVETVLVAVIATSIHADEHGAASLADSPKPPRQTAEVVLLGAASGTIVRGSLPTHPFRSTLRWWRR